MNVILPLAPIQAFFLFSLLLAIIVNLNSAFPFLQGPFLLAYVVALVGIRQRFAGLDYLHLVRLANIRLQDLDYPEVMIRFNAVAGYSGSSDAMPMDRLLGYQFLKAHPTAINFRARKLLVWSRVGG